METSGLWSHIIVSDWWNFILYTIAATATTTVFT